MTRSERRLLIDTSILGLALTFLVTFLEFAGLLSAPERFFYDFRARRCQRYRPPPTTQLVHIDIDDKSLSEMGHWPWPRSRIAEIVDEIRIGGAKTIALDVIFSEPSPYQIDPEVIAAELAKRAGAAASTATSKPTASAPATRPAASQPAALETVPVPAVNNDLLLAQALARFQRAVVPMSLNLNAPPDNDRIYLAMVDEMRNAPQTKQEELIDKLQARSFKEAQARPTVNAKYFPARDEGMFARIELECRNKPLSFEELRGQIFPNLDVQIGGSVELRLLREQYNRFAAVQSMRRFAMQITPQFGKLINTREELATLRDLSNSGWTMGFFDFVRPADGTLRFIPMLADHRGYAYPQLGLAMACAMLDVKPSELIVTKESITIPCKPRPIVIPVYTQETHRGAYDMFMDIPWFGAPVDSGWQTMYDYPNHIKTKQHVSIQFIWEACAVRHRIALNNATADRAIARLAPWLWPHKMPVEVATVSRKDRSDPTSRFAAIEIIVSELKQSGNLNAFRSRPMSIIMDIAQRISDGDWFRPFFEDRELNDEEKEIQDAYRSLRKVQRENLAAQILLDKRRQEIREELDGKAALIGWIAVGSIADVIPTSLHSQCPGVVAHGVIFNAIMTNDFWRRPPIWVTPLITALMGIMVTAIVAILPAWRALAATVALAGGYFLWNAYWLFDKHNLIVGVAGPVTAALVVWAGGTLARFILEANLRAAVTRSFSMRVDPQLVSYVLERDRKVAGEVKELSVVFTDLAGFTTLSERLKEETVPLLNEYMGLMVPVIRKHKGYLNKFLGDGIMYFFGAPYENPNHAYDAIASVLEMQEVMEKFNESLTKRGLPNLAVRAGISSGDMVVGDAGAEDSHDYTVLGDTVNLGARLEPANKVFGTQFLLNARARELAGEKIVFRPIGRIQVAGKTQGVMAYEALALAAKASPGLRDMAEMTNDIVVAFMNANFEGCIAAIERMEETFRVSKLTSLYRRLSEKYIKEGTPAGFDGQIVLSEK